MHCNRITKMISPYIDDQLSASEKELVELHLQGCAECQKVAEETRTLHQLFASVERFSAPYGFATRVAAALHEQETQRGFWGFVISHPFLTRSTELIFALVIVVVGLMSGPLLINQEIPVHGSADVQATFSLDVFDPLPPDSVGGVYVRMVGGTHER